MRIAIAILLSLAAAIAAGQEIVLTGPDSPVEPREYSQILVSGLADADLPAATISWSPTAGTTLVPARTWGGQPFLWFVARSPGKYQISVTVNAWRNNLDAAVDATRRAGTIDAETLARLVAIQRDLATRYPLRVASCAVEVAGVPPTPPPPPPGPDPPPVTKLERALILLDSAIPNEERSRQLALLRNDKTWSKRLEILDARTENENGHPSALVASALQYLAGRPLPRLLGIGAAGQYVFDAELPATAEAVKQTLRDRGLSP